MRKQLGVHCQLAVGKDGTSVTTELDCSSTAVAWTTWRTHGMARMGSWRSKTPNSCRHQLQGEHQPQGTGSVLPYVLFPVNFCHMLEPSSSSAACPLSLGCAVMVVVWACQRNLHACISIPTRLNRNRQLPMKEPQIYKVVFKCVQLVSGAGSSTAREGAL